MPLSTYSELQTSILSWLARPGDPLVSPAVPDMIRLFEAEATRRLKVGEAEQQTVLNLSPGIAGAQLPERFGQMRYVAIDNLRLAYVPPDLLMRGGGAPRTYTLHGNRIRVGPTPDAVYQMDILYQSGVPSLGDAMTSNWLLESHPDAYLFGSLVEAEAYIGQDERIPLWLGRRDAAFSSIETADRKRRWPGGLQIRVDGITAVGGGGDWGTGGGDSVAASLTVRVVTPGSGATVVMGDADRFLYVASGTLPALTIRLPAADAMVTPGEDEIEISFAAPVTALTLTTADSVAISGSPTSAYGPGAALLFRYVPAAGWIYWK